MGDRYKPKPTATVQRCLFNSRIQHQGESVAEFVAALKKLLEYCGFTNAQLKEMLRDCLICGINNERWQKRLLTEDAADYQKVLDVALSLEAAEKSVQDLRGGAKLNKMGSGDRRPPFKGSGRPQLKGEGGASPCYRCGRTNHRASECYFKEAICHNCGKKGHVARACRSRSKAPLGQPQGHKSTSNSKKQSQKDTSHRLNSTGRG